MIRESTRIGSAGRPMNEYTTIATTSTVSRKLVPQRTCWVVKRCADSGVSGTSFSYAAIALCSAPWYMEHAPDVGHQPDEREVAEEDPEDEHALEHVEQKPVDAEEAREAAAHRARGAR